jgi:hypothetical protein
MTIENAITGLIILSFATVLCLAILTIYVDRQRRRIDVVIHEYIYDLIKADEEIWQHLLDKERGDDKEG